MMLNGADFPLDDIQEDRIGELLLLRAFLRSALANRRPKRAASVNEELCVAA